LARFAGRIGGAGGAALAAIGGIGIRVDADPTAASQIAAVHAAIAAVRIVGRRVVATVAAVDLVGRAERDTLAPPAAFVGRAGRAAAAAVRVVIQRIDADAVATNVGRADRHGAGALALAVSLAWDPGEQGAVGLLRAGDPPRSLEEEGGGDGRD